jgi:hypothetical protein
MRKSQAEMTSGLLLTIRPKLKCTRRKLILAQSSQTWYNLYVNEIH